MPPPPGPAALQPSPRGKLARAERKAVEALEKRRRADRLTVSVAFEFNSILAALMLQRGVRELRITLTDLMRGRELAYHVSRTTLTPEAAAPRPRFLRLLDRLMARGPETEFIFRIEDEPGPDAPKVEAPRPAAVPMAGPAPAPEGLAYRNPDVQ